MVRETSEDKEFAEALENRIASRKIAKDFAILRAQRGLSQRELADRMGCPQGRISKLEASPDVNLRLGDLAQYAAALGIRLRLVPENQNMTPVDRVKQLAFRIKHELDGMAGLAKDDHTIAQGVSRFFGEALVNLVKMLQDSAGKLPRKPADGTPYIDFEFSEDMEQPPVETVVQNEDESLGRKAPQDKFALA